MWLSHFLESLSINLGVTNELMLFALIVMIPLELYLAKKFSISVTKFFLASLPSVYISYVVSHIFHTFMDMTVGYIKFLTRPDYSLIDAFFSFYGTATMFYGSLIGCLAGMAICYPLFRQDKKAYLRCFDVTIICFAFSSIFSRIADIYTGESYGFVFDSPFSMHYWPDSVPATDMFTRGLLEQGMPVPPLFPTQPIMVIAKVIILLILLLKCFSDKKKVPLNYVALYFVTYGPYRFCIDFLRFDRASYFLGLTASQWISIVLTILAVLYYAFLYKRLADENYRIKFGKGSVRKIVVFTLIFTISCIVFAWKTWGDYADSVKTKSETHDSELEKEEIFWSEISYTRTWEAAEEYCRNLDEGGFRNWRLPTIDELRTLIQNHSGTKTGGTCRISDKDGRLSSQDRTFRDCKGRKGDSFSADSEGKKVWSSSVLTDYPYDRWFVDFSNGGIYTHYYKWIENYVRCVRNNDEVFDAVIVGGGLAGLSAAYYLKNTLGENAKILLLEKENRLGGRILTKKFGGYSYELGATFGYSPALFPKNSEIPELVIAPDLYGEYKNGELTFSKKVSMRDTYLAHNSNMLGNGEQYGKYEYLAHRAGGNGEMIRAYESELTGRIITNAEVLSVAQNSDHLQIIYKNGEKESEIKAKTVIVATPATVARKIIKNGREKSENFLKSISYYSYSVVNIIAKLSKDLDFAAVYSEDLTLYVTNYENNISSLYCYIHDKQESESIDFAKQRLFEMGILNENSEILNIDSHFWKEQRVVISEENYKNFSVEALNPLPGVFLAGDYTFWNELKLPYGMPPAYFSGKTAAKKVVEYLKR